MVLIVEPSATLEWITLDAELVLERAGRTCYKSEHRIVCPRNTDGKIVCFNGKLWSGGDNCYTPCPDCAERAGKFIQGIIKRGHESVIEHAVASFRFICDRGVTHEEVRHRLCSYSQESTRYCNYSEERLGSGIQVICPPDWADVTTADYDGKAPADRQQLAQCREVWMAAMHNAEAAYMKLIELGRKPQIARSVLPTCLKTEIVHTANLREWRHILRLRTSAAAHPQIREIMNIAKDVLKKECPNVFFDL